MIETLFKQTAVWREVIPSASSLTEEGLVHHRMDGVRFGAVSKAVDADSAGYKARNSAKLYYLLGHSTTDGEHAEVYPAIKMGDTIDLGDGVVLLVVGVAHLAGLGGERHHMEVYLA